jgi:hypothetical protein
MSTRLLLLLLFVLVNWRTAHAELKAGAAMVDVTPLTFPVLVNGNMLAGTAMKATSKLHARAIVVDDGKQRAAIVVVDSCMMPRELLDDAKQLAAQRTKIKPDHMLISATHTHTAPASMGCLGTDADPTYVPYLREKLAEAIAAAEKNLEPAKVGFGVKNAADYTALRRWIIRPDRVGTDPFGNPTLRANMHAGANLDNVTGESGPEDPDLTLISFQSTQGRPIAVLANFSMHYFSGVEPLNADYFGLFCEGLQQRLGKSGSGQPPFVAVMSHGCSGDIWRRDYSQPPPAKGEEPTLQSYTNGLLGIAQAAYDSIEHKADGSVAMAETRMTLNYRVPDKQRLQWAQQIVSAMGDRAPQTTEEVYAREQIILHERMSTELVLQALRIGEIAIASTPTETYALTGLKLKLQSPLPSTMVIELANGGDGYIPPPEQHLLGGYNTWPARSAGLEVAAEPNIVAASLSLLEKVAGQPRRKYVQSRGPAAEANLSLKPLAYWRMDEFAPSRAKDSSGNHRDAFFEPGVVFFLPGPHDKAFGRNGEVNRAAHFAGGRMESRMDGLADSYSVSLWFWNGMPNDGREVAGWLFSRGQQEAVGIGGTASDPGKLIFVASQDSAAKPAIGRTVIERWTWNHLLLVRDGQQVKLYLNGRAEPEIALESPPPEQPAEQWFFGGRSDAADSWEGRQDEIVVFDRALDTEERRAISLKEK